MRWVLSKTPRVQALGVFVFLCCIFVEVAAGCPVAKIDEQVTIARVIDGDTLALKDGRRVRVLGINAPERARDGHQAQPLAEQAQQAVDAFFAQDRRAYLAYDIERKDRYGRLLAHVFNAERQNLAAEILERGLAFQVLVPPNFAHTNCLAAKEKIAKRHSHGVWSSDYWQARPSRNLQLSDTGFRRLAGRVEKVTVGRDIWIELDGVLVIKIAAGDKHLFGDYDWRALRGKQLVLRGWLIDRSSRHQQQKGFKPMQLQLRHPLMLESVSASTY